MGWAICRNKKPHGSQNSAVTKDTGRGFWTDHTRISYVS